MSRITPTRPRIPECKSRQKVAARRQQLAEARRAWKPWREARHDFVEWPRPFVKAYYQLKVRLEQEGFLVIAASLLRSATPQGSASRSWAGATICPGQETRAGP